MVLDMPTAACQSLTLPAAGAAPCCCRNGGHARLPWGLTDHHLLHYQVTLACALQVANLITLQQQQPGVGVAGGSLSGWGVSTS